MNRHQWLAELDQELENRRKFPPPQIGTFLLGAGILLLTALVGLAFWWEASQ